MDKKRFTLTLSSPFSGTGISTCIPFQSWNRLLWLRRAAPSTTLDKVSRKYVNATLTYSRPGVKGWGNSGIWDIRVAFPLMVWVCCIRRPVIWIFLRI